MVPRSYDATSDVKADCRKDTERGTVRARTWGKTTIRQPFWAGAFGLQVVARCIFASSNTNSALSCYSLFAVRPSYQPRL
jgi:hypothetical protein